MSVYWLAIGTLAVWRVTHLFHVEDGPWDVFLSLRTRAGVGVLGRALGCFLCLSLWTALPFAVVIGTVPLERAVLWLALSAGAILLERITTARNAPPPVPLMQYGDDDELLRQEHSTDVAR